MLLNVTAQTSSAGLTPEIEYRFMEVWPETFGPAITGTRVDDNIDNPYHTYCEAHIDYSYKEQMQHKLNKSEWESLISGEPQ